MIRLRHIITHTLSEAWKEAVSIEGPSIDPSCPGAGETAETFRALCKTREKTAEAIIHQHLEHFEGLMDELPDDWETRWPGEPNSEWARWVRIEWGLTFHLLYTAALAQAGGFNIQHDKTRNYCFACLLGKKEAEHLVKAHKDHNHILAAVAFKLSLHGKTIYHSGVPSKWSMGSYMIEKKTTQDIIAAARSVFAV